MDGPSEVGLPFAEELPMVQFVKATMPRDTIDALGYALGQLMEKEIIADRLMMARGP
jgi:hypothetical protein